MPKLVGINHVAVEVGDLDEALAFLGRIFDDVRLRGRSGRMAFVDMGDQFIALESGRTQPPDRGRHIGLVVDDQEETVRRAREAGAQMVGARLPRPVGQPLAGRGLPEHPIHEDAADPGGNGPRRAGEVRARARGAALQRPGRLASGVRL